MTLRALAALACLLVLAACAPDAPRSSPPAPTVAGADPAACATAGGTVRPVCRLGRSMCVVPFKDAGKACTDNAQCEGGCLYEGAPVAADGTTTGACRKDNDPCGCREEVVAGKRANGICVD